MHATKFDVIFDKGRLSEPFSCFCHCFKTYVSNRVEDLINHTLKAEDRRRHATRSDVIWFVYSEKRRHVPSSVSSRPRPRHLCFCVARLVVIALSSTVCVSSIRPRRQCVHIKLHLVRFGIRCREWPSAFFLQLGAIEIELKHRMAPGVI